MLNVTEAIEQYKAELRAEGMARARAEDVINIFRMRGVAVDEATRQRIMACKDLALLERWHARAIFAASTDEIFRAEG